MPRMCGGAGRQRAGRRDDGRGRADDGCACRGYALPGRSRRELQDGRPERRRGRYTHEGGGAGDGHSPMVLGCHVNRYTGRDGGYVRVHAMVDVLRVMRSLRRVGWHARGRCIRVRAICEDVRVRVSIMDVRNQRLERACRQRNRGQNADDTPQDALHTNHVRYLPGVVSKLNRAMLPLAQR